MNEDEPLMPKLPTDPNKMLICEIYQSIQGEGPQMGLPSAFVRVTGCPLRCKWCDEKRALRGGTVMTIDEIVEKVTSFPPKNVCLTGGEPLAHKQAGTLMERFARAGYNVLLETNGAMPLDGVPRLPGIEISMDIKCPSSGMEKRMRFENLKQLRREDQVKFVIADRHDYIYAKEIMAKYEIPCAIVFQPEGGRNMLPLVSWVIEDGLDVRVLPQLHKIIWGEKKGV
jgi:7-carboxy-7-deazaguanine synthase